MNNPANTAENKASIANITRDGLAHGVNLDQITRTFTAFDSFAEFVLDTVPGYHPSLTRRGGRGAAKRNEKIARLADAFDMGCLVTGQMTRRSFRG